MNIEKINENSGYKAYQQLMATENEKSNSYSLSRASLMLVSIIILTLTYSPSASAGTCTIDAVSPISFLPNTSSSFSVSCTESCDIFASTSGTDSTVDPSQRLNVSTGQFEISSISTTGSFSLFVNWVCPNPEEPLEQSFDVNIIGDPDSTNDDNQSAGVAGDPISTFNGELYEQLLPDISLGGPLPLFFSRYYASKLELINSTVTLAARWRHNYQWRKVFNFTSTDKTFISARGRTIKFIQSGSDWILSGKSDIPFQLTQPVQFGPFILLDPRSQLSYEFGNSSTATNLLKISDSNGNTHTLNYDSQLKLLSVSDGLGRTLNFTYDDFPKLIRVDDGQGRNISFGYILNPSGSGFLLDSVTDSRSMITSYAYQLNGLMTSSTKPAGNIPFSQTWTADEKVATQTDASGRTYSFIYAAPDTTITDPLGNSRMHTHTGTGELANSQDTAGLNVVIGSDANGRRNSTTDRLNDVTTMTYHDLSGRLASRVNADGTSTIFSYTARATTGGNTAHDLTGTIHADGTTQSFVYDTAGNLTSRTDQLVNSSTATYNSFGQILTATNKLGGMSSNTYNDGVASANIDQTLLTRTDVAGNTTTFAYDGLRRIIQITRADTSTVGLTYDNTDNLLTSTDENNNTTTLSYDNNNNLVAAQRPLDSPTSRTEFGYDGNDRLLSITNPLGGVVSQSYDQLNRIGTTTDANSNLTTYGYDIHNRLTLITDPMLNNWPSSYDLEGVIASTANPLGDTTQFLSDKMGRITQSTSPLGFINIVSYDSMGRVATTNDPLNQVTTFNRDARGQLSGIALPGGIISTTYTRNALGQITLLTDPSNNIWSRNYDSSGRLISRIDPLAQSKTISYDSRNRPNVITFPGTLGTQTQTYDAASNLTQITYRDNTNTLTLTRGFTFDANNRLTAANSGTDNDVTRSYDAVGRINNSNGISISRDAGGRITAMTLAPTKTITYAYDANDRLISVSDWASGTTTFSHDNANRLTGITRPNGITTTHTWDNDSRLIGISETTATATVSSITLNRDGRGQITTANRNVPLSASGSTLTAGSQSFDAASQVSTHSYDALGRRTASNGNSFIWDPASRLTGSTVDGSTATHGYDALDRRTTHTTGGITRDFVWNDAFPLANISIEKQANVDQQYFVHTPSGALLYSMNATNNARNFYHFDEMGNTILITNDAGATVATYAYSAFGQLIAATGSLDNPFTWQGQSGIMDDSNGYYYIRARFYDANTGRFISRDPINPTTPREINPYQYALNNPFRFVDVSGMRSTLQQAKIDLAKAEAAQKATAHTLSVVETRLAADFSFGAFDARTKAVKAGLKARFANIEALDNAFNAEFNEDFEARIARALVGDAASCDGSNAAPCSSRGSVTAPANPDKPKPLEIKPAQIIKTTIGGVRFAGFGAFSTVPGIGEFQGRLANGIVINLKELLKNRPISPRKVKALGNLLFDSENDNKSVIPELLFVPVL